MCIYTYVCRNKEGGDNNSINFDNNNIKNQCIKITFYNKKYNRYSESNICIYIYRFVQIVDQNYTYTNYIS